MQHNEFILIKKGVMDFAMYFVVISGIVNCLMTDTKNLLFLDLETNHTKVWYC